jgi:hypothetical protein
MTVRHELPNRAGPGPRTNPGLPHSQLSQNAPVDLQEILWLRMSNLSDVDLGPSRISVPGARALFCKHEPVEAGCDAFMVDGEFTHIHPPQDGSLHMTLPDGIREEAMAKGWAEHHPLVAQGRAPQTLVLVYGPRDIEELEVIWSLVKASHGYACGFATDKVNASP